MMVLILRPEIMHGVGRVVYIYTHPLVGNWETLVGEDGFVVILEHHGVGLDMVGVGVASVEDHHVLKKKEGNEKMGVKRRESGGQVVG
jgi:hypothetical protein